MTVSLSSYPLARSPDGLAVAVVLGACSDSSALTPEPNRNSDAHVYFSLLQAAPHVGTNAHYPSADQHAYHLRQPVRLSPRRPLPNRRSNAFASVSAGFFHTCGVRTDGSVECWGFQPGSWTAMSLARPRRPEVPSLRSAPAWSITCGLRTDGSVECWGSNVDGDGNVAGQSTPPGGPFASVSAGGFHTCGLRTDGSVECWGSNVDWGFRQCGLASPRRPAAPSLRSAPGGCTPAG